MVGQGNVRARRTDVYVPNGCACAARSAKGKRWGDEGGVRGHRCTLTSWRNSPCVNWHVRALLPTPPLPITIRRSDMGEWCAESMAGDRVNSFCKMGYNLFRKPQAKNAPKKRVRNAHRWALALPPHCAPPRPRPGTRNPPGKVAFRPKPALCSPPRSLFVSTTLAKRAYVYVHS